MKLEIKKLVEGVSSGNFKDIARALTVVENNLLQSKELLSAISVKNIPIIGITGPPGAGKSTLVNSITEELVKREKKVAILAVDPTSPFNFGALLGDRIRMSRHFNNPNVFIRSIATRGSLGGLAVNIIEMTELLKSAKFDLIIIETVGVGQSEVDIAGIADCSMVVLVPEAGDEIQNIKSGLMEIAQVFVVNKADRAGADTFANNLIKQIKQKHQEIPVFKTIADKSVGVEDLTNYLLQLKEIENHRKFLLMTDKAYQLISHFRMKDVDKKKLHLEVNEAMKNENFNLYKFVEKWISHS